MTSDKSLKSTPKVSTRTAPAVITDNQDMFKAKEKDSSRQQSPFFKVTSSMKVAASSFPTLLMSNGFTRNAARNDAILTLRMIANQAAKNSASDAFLRTLGREISLKQGDFEPEMMMRDALMERFLGKSH